MLRPAVHDDLCTYVSLPALSGPVALHSLICLPPSQTTQSHN